MSTVPTATTLTVAERLQAIKEQGWPIVFDGCHKIYFLTTTEREQEARGFGYDLFPAAEVTEFYKASCGLRFVKEWPLTDAATWGHPLDIQQGEED